MLQVTIDNNQYKLVSPQRISRRITLNDQSQAFYLPKFQQKPVQIGDFVGDITQGGSCNVNTLEFTPHNLTHIETPRHVSTDGIGLLDIGSEIFSGISCFVDLSQLSIDDDYILPEHLSALSEYPSARILVIKTPSSKMSEFHDFSGTDPLAFHPNTTDWLSKNYPNIRLLISDLPSMDKEDDGGKLAAHKNFFELNSSPHGTDKAVVELAYMPSLVEEGYYYTQITIPKIDTDAFLVDVVLYHLKK